MGKRKGTKARKATMFKPGNRFGSTFLMRVEQPMQTDPGAAPTPNYRRLSREEYHAVVTSPVKVGDDTRRSAGIPNTMLLRPKKERQGYLDELPPHSATVGRTVSGHLEVEDYRLVHMPTLARAFHAAAKGHSSFSEGCDGMLVALSEFEEKRGVGVSEAFGCTHCAFIGKLSPLYREIEQSDRPGRNPAEINVGLQLALHSTSLSTTGARRFLSCLTVPGPAVSGLQKAANAFGPKMEGENERDMQDKRAVVKDTLELRGMDRDTPIHAEFDRQYNNPLRNARGHTPFAPATQSRDIVIENVTPAKYVIGFHHRNKLCSAGHAQRRRGDKVECPGHSGCTANLRPDGNIGDEESGGAACAGMLLEGSEPLTVGYLTTDADGRGHKGFRSATEAATTSSTTENLLDQTHLNRSLRRALTNMKLAGDTFSARTSQDRHRKQNRFAEDLTYRVQSELDACRRLHRHVPAEVEKAMLQCVDCILGCYAGEHSNCHTKSLVCTRQKPYHFPYLAMEQKGTLVISSEDGQAIKKALTSRLSSQVLWATRFSTSTQKAEAVNSAFKMTNSKHGSTFSRNAKFRDHSAIHMVNNGPGVSIAKKMEAVGLELSKNSKCTRTLKEMQKLCVSDRQRKKSKRYRTRRAKLRNRRYQLHSESRAAPTTSSYIRDQLLHDHSYPHHHTQ